MSFLPTPLAFSIVQLGGVRSCDSLPNLCLTANGASRPSTGSRSPCAVTSALALLGQKSGFHNPYPYFLALPFFSPHLSQSSLSLRRGGGINILFWAKHSALLIFNSLSSHESLHSPQLIAKRGFSD